MPDSTLIDRPRSTARHPFPSLRRGWKLVMLLVGVIGALGVVPQGRVGAHAQLLEVSPANGAVLEQAPEAVTMRFNETMSLSGGSVRVLNDEAVVVSSPAEAAGPLITVGLPASLPNGTYTIAYEVISADSHRISGASVFHVGEASIDGPVGVSVNGDDLAWFVRLGGVVFSAVGYAGALLAAGLIALSLVADRSRPLLARPGDRDPLTSVWDAWTVRAAVLGAVGLIAATPFRVARLGGGIDALRDNELLRDSLIGPIGQSLALTVGALFVLALAVDLRAPGWLATTVAAVALGGFVFEGHTRGDQRLVLSVLDVLHLSAAAVWFGGVVGLALAFRAPISVSRVAALVRRFSVSAVVAVLVVAAAGLLLSLLILPSVGDLTATGWGWALITKLAMVAVVVALGAYNNRRLVAAVAENGEAVERRRLEQVVRVEIVILLAVVVASAVLVTRSPVSSGPPAPPVVAVPTEDPDSSMTPGTGGSTELLTVELRGGATQSATASAELLVAPASVGTNQIEVLLRDSAGRSINPVVAPTVQFTQTEVGIGPLTAEVAPVYIGDYEGTIELPFSGTWEITVRVRVSDFESISGTTAVDIG